MALHARHLSLTHPLSGEPLEFEVELPADLQGWLDATAAEGPPR
jgi:hypothetical protein